MERFGPQRGTDSVWAQMEGSAAWEGEHRPGSVASVPGGRVTAEQQRGQARPLKMLNLWNHPPAPIHAEDR